MISRAGWVKVGAVIAASLLLVVIAVAGPLSARLTGREFLVAVAPVDPIDPFRGAYVDLDYPTLRGAGTDSNGFPQQFEATGERGVVYVPLVASGELWRGGQPTRDRPEAGPYVRCDDGDWRLRCGIESWFLPQGKARDLEQSVMDGQAVARIRVDGRGNAALVAVEVRGPG